jgi:hypothetical protein
MDPDEIKLSVSFSLKRKMVAGVRARAAYLGVPMSTYVAALIHNDLCRGIQAPLQLACAQAPSGVVVDLDLQDGKDGQEQPLPWQE